MNSRRIDNVRWGARYGVMFGVGCSMLATVKRLVVGPAAFDRFHVGLVTIVTFYLVGGVLCGALVGLMRRIALTRAGSVATGIVACIPISIPLILILSRDDPSSGLKDYVIFVLIFSIVFGGAAGFALRAVFSE